MHRFSHPARTLTLGGALVGALLVVAPVSAQSPPVILPASSILVGLNQSTPVFIPVFGDTRHGGLWHTDGNGDVDFDQDRNREPGTVVFSE